MVARLIAIGKLDQVGAIRRKRVPLLMPVRKQTLRVWAEGAII
jgi:hypothetical protein